MENKKIVRRRYIVATLQVVSPLHISNGNDFHTDSDVLKNSNGEYFIPGTSLAGAFRNYLNIKKDSDCIYGYSKNEDGRMSSVFISDVYFDKKPNINTRDGVKLGDDKGVENKFDMEILEPGVSGILKMEFVEREGDSYSYDETICSILQGIDIGEIRLGANKNRGFGRLKIADIVDKKFEAGKVDEWITFLENPNSVKKDSFDEWVAQRINIERKYVKVTVPLKQVGGISIRRYSTVPDKADYEHIKSNDKPVIPGTSWNGAIRADALRILTECGMSKDSALRKIDEWFGCVKDNKEGALQHQSQIVISESIIEDAKMLPMTRNKINRFTGGTVDSALYSEISCFDGRTKLEYFIKKELGYESLIDIMNLIVKDIQNGYVAIGGQTAVGRGLFEADGEITVEEFKIDSACFGNALYETVKEGH